MRITKFTVALILTFTLLFTAHAFAGPVFDKILKKGELVVGTSGDQVPLSAKTKTGKIIGLDADIATLMAGAMGVKLKLVAIPFPNLLPALEAGKIDMILSGMTITPRRNLKVVFVGPYYVSGKGILTKMATVAAMQDPERMNQPDLRVVTLAGSTSALFAQQALSKAKKKSTRTLDEALEMIMKGTADALIADYPYCVVTAFRHKDKGLIAGKAPFTFEPMGVALPGEDVLLINWVENFLRGFQGTGLMKELQKRWFNPGPWMEKLP